MIRRLLDLLPHDTLEVGGELYMRRWYLGGYAPGRTGRWWSWGFGGPFGWVHYKEFDGIGTVEGAA